MRPSLVHTLPVLLAASLQAAEFVIEERPFTIEAAFTATAIPEGDGVPLRLDAKTWEDFRIVRIASHGTNAKKGDLLVKFDATGIDRKLEDTRRAVSASELAVARTEQELKTLQETAPHKLDVLRRAAEIAKQDHAYFTKTGRKATEETAARELERKKQMLANQQEDLKQLAKMHAADNLTEESETIILARHKDDVAAAEFALRMETLDYQRALEVNLPREAITVAHNERDSAIALRTAEDEVPRGIELKKLELAALKAHLQREQQSLIELEQDRALFEFKAPAAGVFYHGPIENGRWSPGDAVKNLVEGGRPALRRSFAGFIPASATLALVAFVGEADARALKPGLTGTAILTGRDDLEIPVRLTALSAVPETDGSFRADLSATWPKEATPVTGNSARIHMIAYHQERALAIPTDALSHGPKGWTVEVKLTDGKSELRPVKRGRVSGSHTEILSGLEIGQVILAP